MATHRYEAEFTHVRVRCPFGEDFVERSYSVVAGARFEARGDGTASKIANEIAPRSTDEQTQIRIWRVVNGVRSKTDTQQDRIARARRFGGRRW